MDHHENALQNLTFPDSFFEDEVRDGFYISCMMKRYWAAQLTVLAQIDRICRKHNLKWWADNGTLLGAVRHGGYIPWDDDMDICMLRHDWIKFFEVAADELPKDYCVMCLSKEPEYRQMIGRIVNAHAIDYSEAHLNDFWGCPYTVGIDIFPLDGLCEDDKREENRCRKIRRVSQAVKLLESGNVNNAQLKILLKEIERDNHVNIRSSKNLHHDLPVLIEELFMRYSSEDAENVALMPYWISDHDHKYPKYLFDKVVWIPFEHVYIPVPARFEEVLGIEYKQYWKYNIDSGVHNYPVFKEQETILKENIGSNPFRFTLPENTELSSRNIKPLRERCFEILKILNEAHKQLSVLVNSGNTDAAVQLLQSCQSLAVSLGTTAEERIPGSDESVRILEEYCEEIYQAASSEWNESRCDRLDELVQQVRLLLLRALFDRKREVLFLPCKVEWWKSLEPLWKKCALDPDTNVYVMPVPYRLNNRYGASVADKDYIRKYPEEVTLVSPDDYDIAARHPDAIYIQYPFDDFSTISGIPEKYYSRNLLKYTDELIYVPCFDADAPGDEESSKVKESLKVLIEQPAVLFADKVILKSNAMRLWYVKYLWVFSANGDYWVEKTEVPDYLDEELPCNQNVERRQFPSSWNIESDRKLVLFHINASFLLVNMEESVAKIRSVLSIMLDEFDCFRCLFSPHESLDAIAAEESDAGECYRQILDIVRSDKRIILDEDHQAGRYLYGISLYYGNESMLAKKCEKNGKPVVIMNCTV